MIMKLAKKASDQSNSSYSYSVLEYISRPTIAAVAVSGHAKIEVEKCVYFSIHGCLTDDLPSQAREFGLCADSASSSSKNLLRHYIVSLPASEKFTPAQAEETGHMFLEGLGYDAKTAQWAVGLHINTKNNHLHIFTNRQNPESGKLVREGGGWWVKEGLKSLARIEHKFGWAPEKHALYKWDEATGTAVKIRKPKSKDGRVSDRARRMELESGHMSQERILKELCAKIRDMIADIPQEKRSWADAHRAFAQVGIEYERSKNKAGATVTIDGKTYRAASSVAEDFSLKSLEKLIGSTYRSPPKKEAEAMEKAMKEARMKLFTVSIPLPKCLLPSRSKAKYLQGWDRGRFQARLHNEQFQMRARHHSLQKNQQEMSHDMG